MESIERVIFDDVVVESVNLVRATLSDADLLKNNLLKDLEEGFKKVVIDLSECGYMDSSFLGSLIYGLKKVQEAGGNLFLAAPKGDTRNILEITGACNIFEVYDSVDEAVKRFKNFSEQFS
jgi:anti-anti-sigma factor